MALQNGPRTANPSLTPQPGSSTRPAAFAQSRIREYEPAEVIGALEVTGPVSPELRRLLNIPTKLYRVGHGATSFSSDPFQDASWNGAFLERDPPLPQEMPDYGIHIGSWGDSSFCTFVDRSRRVAVIRDVGSIYDVSGGSWDSFMHDLRRALDSAASPRAIEKSAFVISKDGVQRTI